MAAAVRRGVDVRILVPKHSDVCLVQWASRAAYHALLHAKTMVVDSNWCKVGTANLDYRSLNLNYEINLVSRCEVLTELLAAQFERDAARSEVIEITQWHRRPGWRRILEGVAWRLRRWL